MVAFDLGRLTAVKQRLTASENVIGTICPAVKAWRQLGFPRASQLLETAMRGKRALRSTGGAQRSINLAWTEYDDFHGKRFLPERRCISGTAAIGTD